MEVCMRHMHGDGQMYMYGPAGEEKGQEAACGKHPTERACALVNKRRRGGGSGKYGKRPARKPARGKGARRASAERAGAAGGKIGEVRTGFGGARWKVSGTNAACCQEWTAQ